MESSFESLNFLKVLLSIVFLVIYVLAFVVVKPFLLNHKRLISTLSLKVTYILYLGVLLICVFLFMFYGSAETEHNLSEKVFFGLLFCFFIPNLGILFRRHFIKHRNLYNYIFAIINIVITIFIIYKLTQANWSLG